VFLAFHEEILSLMKNREKEAFGLKIGAKIDNISQSYEAEIEGLMEEITKSDSLDDNTARLTKIDSISKNIKKELSGVKQQTGERLQSDNSTNFKKSDAQRLESEGRFIKYNETELE
jgi:hypothetical protein